MKAKKSYDKGGKRPKGLKRSARPKGLKPMTDEQKRNARTIDMDNLKDPRTPRGLKKSEEDNKKMIKMKKGGRMGLPKDISGMGRFGKKLKKITPIGPKKIDSGLSMDKTLKKSAVEVDNKKKRRNKRRKFEMGGTLSAPNVNLRGEGKKKKKKKPAQGMVYAGRPERMANMEKIAPKGPNKIDSGVSMDKTLKKSSAKIPVPAKKKRRLRRK
tara:strand:+ start:25 stop:663 length:639 start_codon:yes stop_codon:yes gene_type:complete